MGAGLYARASFLTFLLVSGSLASVLVSFVAVGPKDIRLTPRPGTNGSSLPPRFGHFTGFNSSTLKDNLGGELGAAVPGSLNEMWAGTGSGHLESQEEIPRCQRDSGAGRWQMYVACVVPGGEHRADSALEELVCRLEKRDVHSGND